MLSYSLQGQDDGLSLHDRMQIALAIADPILLKSLLTDCEPAIALAHQIGSIRASIALPLEGGVTADAVIQYESINCVLIQSQEDLDPGVWEYSQRNGNERGYVDLTSYEAKTRTLGQMVGLSQAIALLSQAGFLADQVRVILHLPHDAWYRSWWYTLDVNGEFTIPFLRLIRTRRHVDGTYTIRYKDFFSDEEPLCFKSQDQKILLEIGNATRGFRETLERINYLRQRLEIERVVLIGDRASELEMRGFISQGISIYGARQLRIPRQANCAACLTADCPMQGNSDSPVMLCHHFYRED